MSNVKKSHKVLHLPKIIWKTSTSCGASVACVEVAKIGEKFAVRDSKNIEAGLLLFTKAEWKAFILGVKNGEFE